MPPAHADRGSKTLATRLMLIGSVVVVLLFVVTRLAMEVVDRVGTADSVADVAPTAVTTTTSASGGVQRLLPPPMRPAGSPTSSGGLSPAPRQAPSGGRSPAPRQARPGVSSRPAPRWQRVLESLDQVRATAWRQARPGLLRQVYLPTAAEGREDRAMLREYAARGLLVRGVSLAFGAVEVAHRAPGVVELRVVDQLRPATAVDQQGRRLDLPQDHPTSHSIELRRFRNDWRIADVRLR